MNFLKFYCVYSGFNCYNVDTYLQRAGINKAARYRITDWVELCSVHARIGGGFKAASDTRDCRVTKEDGIYETRVIKNSEWRCSFSYDTYVADTNMRVYEKIERKYDDAISMANKDGNQIAVNEIRNEKSRHLFEIKTNKNTAILRATASRRPFWGPGGKCDLTLMARLKVLDV